MIIAAFLSHEARTQVRSHRYKMLTAVYLVSASLPAVVLRWVAPPSLILGPNTLVAQVLLLQPLLTAIFAAAISIDGITRELEGQAFQVVSLCSMSNTHYLLGRWIGLLATILPVTIVPLTIGAALARPSAGLRLAVSAAAWPWLLWIFPIALAFSTLALGSSTIAGSDLRGVVGVLLLLGLVLTFGNDLLARFHFTISGPSDWLGVNQIARGVPTLRDVLLGRGLILSAGDAPFDPIRAAASYVPQGVAFVAGGAAALGLAVLVMRRSRSDRPPLSGSALRRLPVIARWFGKLREDHAADAYLGPIDRGTAAAGMVLLSAGVAFIVWRSNQYGRDADLKFRTDAGAWPAPSSEGLRISRARLAVAIHHSGYVATQLFASFENDSASPVSRLVFELNPRMALVRAQTSVGRIDADRSWSRLQLHLEPPIALGSTRAIQMEIGGTPAAYQFAFRSRGDFSEAFLANQHAQFFWQVSDLSRSVLQRKVSVRGLELVGTDFVPVLRSLPWNSEGGPEVKGESSVPIELIVTSRPTDALVSSCASALSVSGTLAARCSESLAGLTILGGPLVKVPTTGPPLLVLPYHIVVAASAWKQIVAAPAVAGSEVTALVENPLPFEPDPWERADRPRRRLSFVGHNLLVPEEILIGEQRSDDSLRRRPGTQKHE